MEQRRMFSCRVLIFPILAIILPAMVIIDNISLFSKPDAFMFIYIENSKKGRIGYGIPSDVKQPGFSWTGLEPGDIILGGNVDCAYGDYSHAGLYLGDNKVLEGFVDSGITINDINSYLYYHKLALLHVNVEADLKQQALDYAMQQEGELFYPGVFKPGEDIWNCTKIIWLAYIKQGIDLDETNDLWIAPDIFLQSQYVTIIAER